MTDIEQMKAAEYILESERGAAEIQYNLAVDLAEEYLKKHPTGEKTEQVKAKLARLIAEFEKLNDRNQNS